MRFAYCTDSLLWPCWLVQPSQGLLRSRIALRERFLVPAPGLRVVDRNSLPALLKKADLHHGLPVTALRRPFIPAPRLGRVYGDAVAVVMHQTKSIGRIGKPGLRRFFVPLACLGVILRTALAAL